jgi:basic amino acid/polyamine antiporter, APA family
MAATRPGEPAGSPHVAGDEALVRGITFWPAAMLVVGNVVGSAAFLTTGVMVEALPSAPLVLAAWLAGGLLTCAGGLTLAEMGAMLPRSGGMYVFLEEAYGPFVAFLFGWAMTLVILPGSIAAVAVGFAASFSYFAPAWSATHVLATIPLPFGALAISAGQVVAAASIAALTVVNLLSVTTTSRLAAAVTFLKVAAIVVIPVAALVVWPQTPAWTPVVPPVARPLATFGVVMIAVMWAYDGWSYLAFAAGEVHDPARTLPRAFIFGTLGVTALYVLINVGYFVALPLPALSGELRVAEKAMTAVMGPSGAMLVAAIVCVSTLGCNLSGLLSCSRMGYGMAIDGMFFRFAALVHPASRTPYGALLGLAAWSCALTISGSYEQLFTYVIFAAVLFNVLGGFAIFRLRRTHASVPRPYRTWGYPVVPILFVLGSLGLVVNTFLERPVESLAGLLLMAAGVPAYVYWRRPRIAGTAVAAPR